MPKRRIVPHVSPSQTSLIEAPGADSEPKKINKSEWVRNLARDLSARDVVALAASQGIVLGEKQVYVIRSNANKALNKTVKKPVGRPRKEVSESAPQAAIPAAVRAPKSSTKHSVEDAAFITAALNIGLSRSRELLQSVEERLLAFI